MPFSSNWGDREKRCNVYDKKLEEPKLNKRKEKETEEGNSKGKRCRPRNPDNEPIGHKFKMITEKIHKHQDEALRKDDLTFSQMGVLLTILFHGEEPITTGEICGILHITHPSAVGLINRLEEKKMVERSPNPNDSRSSFIKLTKKAWDFLQKNRKYNEQMDQDLIKDFSEEEVKQLRNFLDRIYSNVEQF